MTKHDFFPNFFTSPDWGSANFQNRVLLRAELSQFCTENGFVMTTDFMDLDVRPRLSNGFISISHCRSLGGFVVSENAVGLDIEETDRVTEKVVRRVCSAEEIQDFLKWELPWAALWTAKEAGFKCFGGMGLENLLTLSQIRSTWLSDISFNIIFDENTSSGKINFYSFSNPIFIAISQVVTFSVTK